MHNLIRFYLFPSLTSIRARVDIFHEISLRLAKPRWSTWSYLCGCLSSPSPRLLHALFSKCLLNKRGIMCSTELWSERSDPSLKCMKSRLFSVSFLDTLPKVLSCARWYVPSVNFLIISLLHNSEVLWRYRLPWESLSKTLYLRWSPLKETKDFKCSFLLRYYTSFFVCKRLGIWGSSPPLSTKALPNILAEVLLSQVKFNSRNYRQKELVKSYSSTDGSWEYEGRNLVWSNYFGKGS